MFHRDFWNYEENSVFLFWKFQNGPKIQNVFVKQNSGIFQIFIKLQCKKIPLIYTAEI